MAKKKARTKFQSLRAAKAAECRGTGSKSTTRKRASAYVKHAVSSLGRSASAAEKKKEKARATKIANREMKKTCSTSAVGKAKKGSRVKHVIYGKKKKK